MSAIDHAFPTGDLNVPGPNLRTVEFFAATDCRRYAEVGVYRGDTALRIAELMAGDGEVHVFDFDDRLAPVVERLSAAGHANVIAHPNSRRLMDSYNWSLMRLLAKHDGPVFDYVFLDGAHTWALDALAFLPDRPAADPRRLRGLRRLQLDTCGVTLDASRGVPGRAQALQRRADRPSAGRAGGRPPRPARPPLRRGRARTRSSARPPPDARQRVHPNPQPGPVPGRGRAQRPRPGRRGHGGSRPRRRLGRRDPASAGAIRTRGCASCGTAHRWGSPPTATRCVDGARGEATSRGSTRTTCTCRHARTTARACSSRHPRVGLVHGGFEVIDGNGRPLRAWPPAVRQDDRREPAPDAFRDLIAVERHHHVDGGRARSAQREAGPFAHRSAPAAPTGTCGCGSRCAPTSPTPPSRLPAIASTSRRSASARRGAASGCAAMCASRATCCSAERRPRRTTRAPPRARARAALAAKRAERTPATTTPPGERGEALRAVAVRRRDSRRRTLGRAARCCWPRPRGDDYRVLPAAAADAGGARRAARAPALRHAARRGSAAEDPTTSRRSRASAANASTADAARRAGRHGHQMGSRRCCGSAAARGVQFPDRRQMPDGYPGGEDACDRALRAAAQRRRHASAFTAATSLVARPLPGLRGASATRRAGRCTATSRLRHLRAAHERADRHRGRDRAEGRTRPGHTLAVPAVPARVPRARLGRAVRRPPARTTSTGDQRVAYVRRRHASGRAGATLDDRARRRHATPASIAGARAGAGARRRPAAERDGLLRRSGDARRRPPRVSSSTPIPASARCGARSGWPTSSPATTRHVTIGERIGAARLHHPDLRARLDHDAAAGRARRLAGRAAPPGRCASPASRAGAAPYGPIDFEGQRYGLRVHEFRRFADLPRRDGRPVRARARHRPGERRRRARCCETRLGLVDPSAVAATPSRYRRFIQGSRAELMVAKGMYVDTAQRLVQRAQHLLPRQRPAGARPGHRPGGPLSARAEGSCTFSTLDEAAAGIECDHWPITAAALAADATRAGRGPLRLRPGAVPAGSSRVAGEWLA